MRAEKGMVVLFLPKLSERIAWPKGCCLPCRLRSPHRQLLGVTHLHLPVLCLVPPFHHHSSLCPEFLLTQQIPLPLSEVFLLLAAPQGQGPFLEGWWAGPRTKTDPDPIFFSLCPPACRPWNYSLPSRIPSSLTFIQFPGWMERPGQRPRTR